MKAFEHKAHLRCLTSFIPYRIHYSCTGFAKFLSSEFREKVIQLSWAVSVIRFYIINKRLRESERWIDETNSWWQIVLVSLIALWGRKLSKRQLVKVSSLSWEIIIFCSFFCYYFFLHININDINEEIQSSWSWWMASSMLKGRTSTNFWN